MIKKANMLDQDIDPTNKASWMFSNLAGKVLRNMTIAHEFGIGTIVVECTHIEYLVRA